MNRFSQSIWPLILFLGAFLNSKTRDETKQKNKLFLILIKKFQRTFFLQEFYSMCIFNFIDNKSTMCTANMIQIGQFIV